MSRSVVFFFQCREMSHNTDSLSCPVLPPPPPGCCCSLVASLKPSRGLFIKCPLSKVYHALKARIHRQQNQFHYTCLIPSLKIMHQTWALFSIDKVKYFSMYVIVKLDIILTLHVNVFPSIWINTALSVRLLEAWSFWSAVIGIPKAILLCIAPLANKEINF